MIVTGSTAGIGEEIAYAYCAAGAHVVLVARNEQKLQAVQKKCKDSDYVVADFENPSDEFYKGVVEKAAAKLGGRIDTLVLNHVITTDAFDARPWVDIMDMAKVRRIFDVNTFSYFSLANHAYRYLDKSNGIMVVVSSTAGLIGLPRVTPYSSSKHALMGYFDSLRQDLTVHGKTNVAVVVCPLGAIDTDNARANTKGVLDHLAWYSAKSTAEAIIAAGEARSRYCLYPYPEIRAITLLKAFNQPLADFVVRNVM